ncbi:MAG: response regulator transcription factor [Bacilli bacterium]|nr:response regulator transcription factor [Bacilli bacterium]
MINFIVCEDIKELSNKYKQEIDKFMMKYDIDYKCHMYTDYGKEWQSIAKKEMGFKIYLLDIVTKNGSGLDAARLIREEYDDWSSMIIIITSYPEYKYEALGKRLMLVDFISKVDNCEKKLQDAFLICMKNYDKKYKSLKYTYKNTVYNLEFRNIISIEKEQDSKRCLIKTIHGNYYIPGSLNQVLKKLDKRFFKCHRSMAVNINQIERYNQKKNTIYFKNETKSTLVARNKKKELMDRVRSLN